MGNIQLPTSPTYIMVRGCSSKKEKWAEGTEGKRGEEGGKKREADCEPRGMFLQHCTPKKTSRVRH